MVLTHLPIIQFLCQNECYRLQSEKNNNMFESGVLRPQAYVRRNEHKQTNRSSSAEDLIMICLPRYNIIMKSRLLSSHIHILEQRGIPNPMPFNKITVYQSFLSKVYKVF